MTRKGVSPRSASVRGGVSTALPTLALLPARSATVRYPTPTASVGERGGRGDLLQVVRGNPSPSGHFKLWPTPWASANENRQTKRTPSQIAGKHGRSLAAEVNAADPGPGGQLNPTWVEWLMGYPAHWTQLRETGHTTEDAT